MQRRQISRAAPLFRCALQSRRTQKRNSPPHDGGVLLHSWRVTFVSGEVSPEHDERAEDGKHDHGHDSSDDGVVNLLRGAFTRPGVWKTGGKSHEDLIHCKKKATVFQSGSRNNQNDKKGQ